MSDRISYWVFAEAFGVIVSLLVLFVAAAFGYPNPVLLGALFMFGYTVTTTILTIFGGRK